MIDRDEPLRECYAFNKNGQRCSHPAGHRGEHAVIITWGDDECWTPGGPTLFTAIAEPVIEHLVDIPKPSGKCVICDHPMHTGICGRPDGDDFECDCANGVEE